MAYHLEGNLVELCTCGTTCSCRVQGPPAGGDCEAVNVWHIATGAIEQTDVSGLTLVELSHLHGHVLAGRTVVFYVDERATNEQRDALLAAWTGKLGGPIADLAQLIGAVAGVERAPIAFTINGGRGFLQVGQVVNARFVPTPSDPGSPSDAHAAVSHEEAGHAAARDGDICTTIVGSQSVVGEAATYRVAAPAYGFAIDLRDHKVIQGRFHFDG
jgi:hypothetical protein